MKVHDLIIAAGRVVDGCDNPWYAGGFDPEDVHIGGDHHAACLRVP